MKSTNRLLPSLVGIACVALAAIPAHAAVTLTNGSFETTGALYLGALGGLAEASGWTNLSPSTNFQASSAVAANPPNGEFTSPAGTATGSRYLRLVTDISNFGALAQNLGTMTAGETYTITADIFGGPGDGGQLYTATISLQDTVSLSPAITYVTQTVSGIANGAFVANAFNSVSYTATLADNGQPLVLLLRGPADVGSGKSTRGGLDNIQLTVIPEPSAALLGGLGILALLRRRRC